MIYHWILCISYVLISFSHINSPHTSTLYSYFIQSSLRGVTQSIENFNDASNVVPTSNYLYDEEEDSYADVDMELIGKGKGGGGGGGKKKGGGGKKKKKGGRSGGGKKRSKKRSNKRSNRRSRRRSSSSSRSSRSSRSSSSSTSSDRRSFRSGLCGSNMRDDDRELCNRLEDEFCRTSSQRRSSFCRQLGIDFVVSETLLENNDETEYYLEDE